MKTIIVAAEGDHIDIVIDKARKLAEVLEETIFVIFSGSAFAVNKNNTAKEIQIAWEVIFGHRLAKTSSSIGSFGMPYWWREIERMEKQKKGE